MRGLVVALAVLGGGVFASAGTAKAQAEERPRVAVLALESRESVEEAEATAEELRQAFVNSGRYVVVDRTLTTKITEEWSTQQSGLTDQERALKVGRLFNVQLIVTGKLNRFSGGGWQISAVMIDAQSGVTRKAETVRHRGDFFTLLDTQVPVLAQRLLTVNGAAGSQGAAGGQPVIPMPVPPSAPMVLSSARLKGVVTRKADMPEGRADHAAVMAGGQLFVFGGISNENRPLDTVLRYDPGANQWHPAGTMPVTRSGAGAALLGGRVYVVGGLGAGGVLARVDVFDPAGGSWRQAPALNGGRTGAVVAALGGRLIVVGGLDHEGQPLAAVDILEPGASAWRSGAPLPNPRAHAAGVVAGGQLYVIGGSRSKRGGLAYVDRYDPVADAWRSVANLRNSRGRPAAEAFGDGLYLFGGRGGTFLFASPNGEIERYDPRTDAWEDGGKLASGVFGHTASRIGNTIYLVGGFPEAQSSAVYEVR